MDNRLKSIKKSDHKRVNRALELWEQLENPDLESTERRDLLQELLGLLKQLARTYPLHPLIQDVAAAYLTLGGHLGPVLLLLERLKSSSKDRVLHGILGEAYLREEQLFCAYENMSFFIENSEVDVSREYLSMFETLKPEYEKAHREFVEEMGVDFRDQQEHEKAQVLMHGGEVKDATRIIARLAKKYPHVANVMNNMGILLINSGKIAEAERHFRKVLSLNAENLFATAQLARLALYRNDIATTVKLTEQLMMGEQKSTHLYYELVQLNAFLGRDEEILSLYRSYDGEYPESRSVEDGTIRFFGAVALLRTGNRKAGRKLLRWLQKKNDILPHLTRVNLADLGEPEDEQNGPAYFSLQNLFPPYFLLQLAKINDRKGMEKTRNLLLQHKKLLISLFPTALRSGDEFAREYVIDMYGTCQWEEMLDPLLSFMAGQAGSDELRRKAFSALHSAGKLTGEVEMYQGGEKSIVRTFLVTEEPRDEHFTKEQRELNIRAFDHVYDGDAAGAIAIWEHYLQEHGEDPSVLNNLAAQYEKAGRNSERDAMIDRLEEGYPDYFFYKMIKAGRCIAASEFTQAREILDSELGRDEYHVSEMKLLCHTNINYYVETKAYTEALQWYKTASMCLPDDPDFNNPEKVQTFELLERLVHLQKKGRW